jgi:hypothetical protein
MKKILLFIIFSMFFLPYTYSQEGKFQFTVKADRDSYKSGEKIVLTAELKNISEVALKTNDFIKPMMNKDRQYLVEYVLINKRGRIENLRSQITIPDKLLPGQSVTDQMTWTLHRRKHRSILGKQRIHVNLASTITSNEITVEVAPKVGESVEEDAAEDDSAESE